MRNEMSDSYTSRHHAERRGPVSVADDRRAVPETGRTLLALIALSAAAFSLGACDKTSTPPAVLMTPAQVEPAATAGPTAATPTTATSEASATAATAAAADPAASTSVPAVDTVLAPAPSAPKADHKLGRSNETMTPAQESAGMPLAGQANDHSAPTSPAKRASAP